MRDVRFQMEFEGRGLLCYKLPLYSPYLHRYFCKKLEKVLKENNDKNVYNYYTMCTHIRDLMEMKKF